MKEIIPNDSRYVPFTQQKECCVPACFQMIMYKHGIPLLPQELIGYELGLVVPDQYADRFWNPRTGKPHSSGYGTNVGEGKDKVDPNIAFKKLGIPLQVKFKYIDEFDNFNEFKSYIEDFVEKDKDVIACFDWGTFSGNKDHKWGHVCLIDWVENDRIRLIDPGYNEPKWEMVSAKLFFGSMKAHTRENAAGFWEVGVIK